ncbi:2-oxoglutarate dehydrogenase E1 component [Prosthecomicrobium hirschii]|uniref:2-oxoglutarate dehydrogenase E1 component n=1 Tax=Prosthecodimorpha hirschii TaxID=665126 RepID=UPI00112EB514|nr:2-oxoglutarate dehydrogenase E1 component [Prosthecomicrobium hirschii]TPQ49308.1 2-oxoglutarate dehydrogenase E1 component [Prosthecomicrobium hirschii]
MELPIGGDSAFFLDLYARYRRDPGSVPADWVLHFQSLDGAAPDDQATSANRLAHDLLDAYRRYGHREARLDPLAIEVGHDPVLARLRATAAAHARETVHLTLGGDSRRMSLAEAEALMRAIYAGGVGIEADHLPEEAERSWWHDAVERSLAATPEDDLLASAFVSVALADEFESFTRVKFPTKKRFGIEGAETAMVFVREVLSSALAAGMRDVVMGGMHRGRLATLAVALGKSPATLFAEIMGRDLVDGEIFTGDVPYHLGYATELSGRDGRTLRLTLLPHPSHLMVVAPVALGLARAVSRAAGDGGAGTLCLLLHTDAAFSGQGLTAELLQVGGLAGYRAGGSIHLVVNNQIGFTTLPSEGRCSRYCTDVAKAVGAPVLHVNGDDPVAVARVARLALGWKRDFGRDVVVDLVCYRRNGHNELDEPRFTQPDMWRRIDARPPVRSHLAAAIERAGRPPDPAAAAAVAAFRDSLQAGYASAADTMPNEPPMQGEAWADLRHATERDILAPVATGVDLDRLRAVGIAASTIPDGFAAHPKVAQFYEARLHAIRSGAGVNFASAEALAFATLLADGARIRLSGEDTVRGTFTQRHTVVHDGRDGRTCTPVKNARPDAPDAFEIFNSPLSEYGVLGFEYGHSLFDPNQLTLWEAQFGDFLNIAQAAVDQYIVSAESKWGLKSGLVLLLPHGLEGQGPDHSSARIERLTQLCAHGNVIVAQPTTPANLFHLLRRQICAPWRKPLFVIAPKSLLRAKAAVSPLTDFAAETQFRPVIAEPCQTPEAVRRIVLCSGKIAYDLERQRHDAGRAETVLPVRVEQIYPVPADALRSVVERHPGAHCVWLQEEPVNQGVWPSLQGELARAGLPMLAARPVVARPASPVPAGGSVERHEREQAALLRRALHEGWPE